MRIAFVGKGGSGKTTLTVLFSQYLREQGKEVALVDADLNMNTPALLGYKNSIPEEKHISHPNSISDIQTFLKKDNQKIKELKQFRKTTPPTMNSQLISLNHNNLVFQKYSTDIDGIKVMVVGTYQEDGIGTACYHNNLSIFENILTHLIDSKNEVLVADMVAGVDSFANTLHAQFDLIVLVVEPTLKGVGVYKQFEHLAQKSNVEENVFVIGNKVRSQKDKEFLTKHIPLNKLIAYFGDSELVRDVDQDGGKLDLKKLEKENVDVLEKIEEKLFSINPNFDSRYQKLIELHRRYVAQSSIKERFGDLTTQIDDAFSFEEYAK